MSFFPSRQLYNVAIYGTASQIHTNYGGIASRAIDGNTNGNFGNGSVTHTWGGRQAWWRVELPFETDIQKIRLWNRDDCCKERLSNSDVFILDDNNNAVTSRYIGDASQMREITFDFPGGIFGQAVLVKLRGRDYLSLAEVEVLSFSDSAAPSSSPSVNPTSVPSSIPSSSPAPSVNPTSVPSSIPSSSLAPSNAPTITPLHFGGWSYCTASNPCGQCQGDCDGDAECQGDMVCHQRDRDEAVPFGCGGTPVSGVDYCVEPSKLGNQLKFVDFEYCNISNPCGKCSGDCDSDAECQGNLVCHQRDWDDPGPPGCDGIPESIADYCGDP